MAREKGGKDRLPAAACRRADGNDAACSLPTCCFRANGWKGIAHTDTIKERKHCMSKAFWMLNSYFPRIGEHVILAGRGRCEGLGVRSQAIIVVSRDV